MRPFSDDEVIGAGGTIAKYAKEGNDVIVVIFTFGEGATPVKEEVIIRKRINEAKDVDKLLGVKETIFLGLEDTKIKNKIHDIETLEKIRTIIEKYQPNKIFTHSSRDFHRDHNSVNKIITKVVDALDKHYDLYIFDVSNPFNIFRKNLPKLYVDISDTFDLKLKALDKFKSQKHWTLLLMPSVITKARIDGDSFNCRYAEKFFKIR